MNKHPTKHSLKANSASASPLGRCTAADVLLTVREVAQLDQCSEKTVRRAIAAGRLHSIRVGVDGRLVRIRKADHTAYRSGYGY